MQQLPPDTVRLLSSSQTITSVVNVVKELVENSLDGNATNIEVKLENSGFDRIEVRDNGDGIKAADTPVMGLKHYTSKISHHEDLEALETYGFRGEALGSICTVSEVIVTTKTTADEVSTQYTLDNTGHIISQKPSHVGQGTTVTVLKLFKNIPVRKQFYSTVKKCKEELKKVQDLLMAYGIIKPDLRIVFTHNKAVVWQKAKVSDHKMALLTVLGTAVMVSMVPIQHHEQEPEIFLSGFLPKPGSNPSSTSLTSPDRSFISVNSRPVHHKEILKLVRQYYSSQCQKDSSHTRYPIFFLNISVPASVVDVNLTPDKTQIMLHNKEAILLVIEKVLISVYGQLAGNGTDKSSSECLEETGLIHSGEPNQPGLLNAPEISEVADTINGCSKKIHFSNDKSAVVVDKEESFVSNIVQTDSQEKPLPSENKPSLYFSEFDVTFSLDDDLILANNLPDINSATCPEKTGNPTLPPVTLNKQIAVAKVSPELTADNWSMGHGMKDSTEHMFEPVKLLVPKDTSGEKQINGDEAKHQKPADTSPTNEANKKSSNVVKDKIGQITIYDLISNRTVRKSLSPSALFTQETRPKLLAENPRANLQDVSMKLEEMWKNLNEEEKTKYEEKAAKDLDRYNLQLKKAMEGNPHQEEEKRPKLAPAAKVIKKHHNAPLSNQQILDKLFQSQIHKKTNLEPPCKTIDVPFSLSHLKKRLEQLSKSHESGSERVCLINCLTSYNGWIVASDRKLMLLNPFRVEEALLFRRLMENHIFQTEILDAPIALTNSLLGGPQYIDCLCKMQQKCTTLNGITYFTDPRLVFNGFKIQLIPGASTAEHHLEIEEMARCLPFYGISDLREILNAILNKNAQSVHLCRPLKVINYLKGEAVRLTRQLPLRFSREDIEDTMLRMQQQLGKDCRSCIHGRTFLHHLANIPEID
ncbi:PMS1 protein homolog 1 isoform X1 [Scyliorhinus canicula]|uniref:PMS1 protein homolog 1 isoform X1 n=1 Tax=Scyliorhinus canicula TaxID=7830 RepID=UPI0018F362FF|nr:PMS1 protein homolog 1 isoform X1 [Scyliorhinus canicula]